MFRRLFFACARRALTLGVIALLGLAPAAPAGTILVGVKEGSNIVLSWQDDTKGKQIVGLSDGGIKDEDGEMNGVIEYTIPREDHVVGKVLVCKEKDPIKGKRTWSRHDINAHASLKDFEPFHVPVFTALPDGAEVIGITDLGAFASQPGSFQVGQTIDVVNGAVPGTTAITIKDLTGATGDLNTELFDDTFVAGLPNYTGPVFVSSIDLFGVPEPSTLVLLSLGMPALLAVAGRRCGRRAKGASTLLGQ
jgi:hypothetical protein